MYNFDDMYFNIQYYDCYCIKVSLLLLIFIYFMMALLICKYESKSQCRISDTQVYIKAHGPLVSH